VEEGSCRRSELWKKGVVEEVSCGRSELWKKGGETVLGAVTGRVCASRALIISGNKDYPNLPTL